MNKMRYIFLLVLLNVSFSVFASEPCEFKIISIEGQKVLKDHAPTMSFKDGKVFGVASCNRYQASFENKSGRITIGQGMSTLMACYPQSIMDQENKFLSILPLVTGESKTKTGIIFLDKNYNKLFEVERCN